MDKMCFCAFVRVGRGNIEGSGFRGDNWSDQRTDSTDLYGLDHYVYVVEVLGKRVYVADFTLYCSGKIKENLKRGCYRCHLRVRGFPLGIKVSITNCTEVSDDGANLSHAPSAHLCFRICKHMAVIDSTAGKLLSMLPCPRFTNLIP